MEIYNKLVRDKIPDIIRSNSEKPKTRILNDSEFEIELLKKLLEETQEVINAKGDKKEITKEISDVYEVIDAIANIYSINKKEIAEVKKYRREKRGGFKNKIYLESVE